MNRSDRTIAFVLTLSATALAGCGDGDTEVDDGKLSEASVKAVEKNMGFLAAYAPYIATREVTDPYEPKDDDVDRATQHAANEVRFAANGARQDLQREGGSAAEALMKPFIDVAATCADVPDKAGLAKCQAAVAALEPALAKAEEGGAKLPRVNEAAVTAEAKETLVAYLLARGPGKLELEFIKKRADDKASLQDVLTACSTLVSDLEMTADRLEKVDEPVRLIAVTHHQGFIGQCAKLGRANMVMQELALCEGKDTPECKDTCGKAKATIEQGIIAAALRSLEASAKEICKEE